MIERPTAIPPDERGLAVMAHLSGLSGYLIPFGGILVPFVIWIVKRDSETIARIGQQVVLLNVAALLFLVAGAGLALSGAFEPTGLPADGFPLGHLFALATHGFSLGLLVELAHGAARTVLLAVAVVLPVVGAIKASQGEYYRYPVIGRSLE